MNLRPGDILFFKTYSFSGMIIRALQRKLYGNEWFTDANHVAICVESPDTLREAVIPKSTLRASAEIKNRELILIIRPRYYKPKLAKLWAEKQKKLTGQYYGLLNVFGLLYVGVSQIFGKKFMKNPMRAGRICTEDSYLAIRDFEREHGVEHILDHHINASSLYISELLTLLAEHPDYEVLPMKEVMDYLKFVRKPVA